MAGAQAVRQGCHWSGSLGSTQCPFISSNGGESQQLFWPREEISRKILGFIGKELKAMCQLLGMPAT